MSKDGLWANIHAKRERIKRGSGEKMRKPGSEGAPTEKAIRQSQTEETISRAAKIIKVIRKAGEEAANPESSRTDVEKERQKTMKVVRKMEEQEDLFDFVYNFLISEDLTAEDALDIMACVPIERILEVIELDEEFKDLTPEKEKRVERRVGELTKDVLDSHEKMVKLRNKPFAKHRPGVRQQAAEVLKNAKKKQQLVQNASDALIRTSVGKSAKIQKRIEDLKKDL